LSIAALKLLFNLNIIHSSFIIQTMENSRKKPRKSLAQKVNEGTPAKEEPDDPIPQAAKKIEERKKKVEVEEEKKIPPKPTKKRTGDSDSSGTASGSESSDS